MSTIPWHNCVDGCYGRISVCSISVSKARASDCLWMSYSITTHPLSLKNTHIYQISYIILLSLSSTLSYTNTHTHTHTHTHTFTKLNEEMLYSFWFQLIQTCLFYTQIFDSDYIYIAINRNRNKRFCLHNICVYTVYVYLLWIYKYTHIRYIYIRKICYVYI